MGDAETDRGGDGGAERRPGIEDEIADAVAAAVATVEAAGAEVDQAGVAWLAAALSATAAPGAFATRFGFWGHELAVLDFDPASGDRLRRLGAAVATPPAPDLAVALAVTGSAAQSRVQAFPADTDYFERLQITAPAREAALARLADIVRETVARVEARPGFELEEVWFGTLPASLAAAQTHRVGSALSWRRAEVAAGEVALRPPGGPVGRVTWAAAATDPGFVKFDWFVAEAGFGGPRRVSKVVDPTWPDPSGRVVSLDGAIDGEYQQIYLASAAADLVQGLVGGGSTGGDGASRAAYAAAMERDVVAFGRCRPPDYCKVAKRLYNLCRMTGRYPEALFVRALLARGPTRLSRIRAALEVAALGCGDALDAEGTDALAEQLEQLRRALGEDGLDGSIDACRAALAERDARRLEAALGDLDARLRDRINAGFRDRLRGYRPTAALLAELEAKYP